MNTESSNNAINILTLKVGEKYGSEYINRLYSAMRRNTNVDFNFYCYTDDDTNITDEVNIIPLTLRDDVFRQWYKIDFHHMPNIQGKCLVLDIDYVIVGNLDDILSWDLPNKHFGCQERWWSNLTGYCNINGGFQMFYQGDTMDLYNKFYESPKYWQRYYIQRGEAKGPVNGEQNFIDNHCKLERSWLPPEWFAKYKRDQIFDIQCLWSKRINSEDYFFMCNEFHEDIKMVHFSDAENTMHESDDDWLRYYWYG